MLAAASGLVRLSSRRRGVVSSLHPEHTSQVSERAHGTRELFPQPGFVGEELFNLALQVADLAL
jgi:hypothetical protein